MSATAPHHGPDSELGGRIASFELAFRMQTEAPEIKTSPESRRRPSNFTASTTPPRPTSGCSASWRVGSRNGASGSSSAISAVGTHNNLKADHRRLAQAIDKPIAGLLDGPQAARPLGRHARGLGGRVRPHPDLRGDRRPRPQSPRLHDVAGRRRREGGSPGATDDYGYYAVEDKVHVHDLHATILHLLGLDHKRLTYRYAGRDFRLTDVPVRSSAAFSLECSFPLPIHLIPKKVRRN